MSFSCRLLYRVPNGEIELHRWCILHVGSGVGAQGVGNGGAVGLGVTWLRHDHHAVVAGEGVTYDVLGDGPRQLRGVGLPDVVVCSRAVGRRTWIGELVLGKGTSSPSLRALRNRTADNLPARGKPQAAMARPRSRSRLPSGAGLPRCRSSCTSVNRTKSAGLSRQRALVGSSTYTTTDRPARS